MRLLRVLRDLMGRSHREQDLDDEIRAHIEMAVRDRMARGESREAAERAVRREFGNESRVREVTRGIWQGRLGRWWDGLRQDVRFGVRSLMRHPRYSVAAILTLALGLGAAVTVFSAVETVLLRPLPYQEPSRLVMLETHRMSLDELDGSSVPDVEDWGAMSRSLAGVAYFRRPRISQTTVLGELPRREQEGLVGPGFFELVGAPPTAGRTFTRQELEAGAAVAVLREDLWEDHFATSEFRAGETVSIDGEEHDVIGIMPAVFELPTPDTRLWRPLAATAWWREWGGDRRTDGVMGLARLRDGVGLEDARLELGQIAARLRAEYQANADEDVRVTPLAEYFRAEDQTRVRLWVAFAAVLLLLGVACANVAGLTTVRARHRMREIGVRSVLGARRGALLRQLLAESLILSGAATALGVGLAFGAVELMRLYGPLGLPRFDQLSLSPVAVGFAAVAGALTAALFGTLPALRLSSASPGAVLKGSGRGGRSGARPRAADELLVASQVAVAFVLLIASGLLVESFVRARAVDPGFEPRSLAVVSLDLPESRYPDDPELLAFHRIAGERLEALPEVEATGAISGFFLDPTPGTDPRGRAGGRVAAEGGTVDWPGGLPPRIEGHGVTVGYLEAMGIQLIEGRYFEAGDLDLGERAEAGAAAREAIVISRTMAEALWPGRDPIGRSLQLGAEVFDPEQFAHRVIGVVEDVRREGLDAEPAPTFYIGDITARMDVSVRTTGDASAAISSIRGVVNQIDPALPITIRTADEVFRERLSERRFQSGLLSGFAILALLLSASGIYALVSYYVASRTREIGLRSALGAPGASTVLLITRRCGGPVLVGLGAGLLIGIGVARSLEAILFEVQPLDPAVYGLAIALLLTTAGAAAWGPARRAAGIEPLEAMRADP